MENDKKTEEFFDLLDHIQSTRIDEQRYTMPAPDEQVNNGPIDEELDPIKEVLLTGGPYSMVVLPVAGEYWMEGTNHICNLNENGDIITSSVDEVAIEEEESIMMYRKHFMGKEHLNFICQDENLGPLLLSVKNECVLSVIMDEITTLNQQDNLRVILRTSEKNYCDLISVSNLSKDPGPKEISKYVLKSSDLDLLDPFQVVAYPKASELISKYDEHGISNSFKIGVIYQKFGQVSEEEYFNNECHSDAMMEFLEMLGEEVDLQDFKGYRGGLDVKFGQTGSKSYHTYFKEREIMFHVSTMLPYTDGDIQQLQRKRHIGNDIVSIVFQDQNTPFCPTSVTSRFLHVFIVVQVEEPNTDRTRYKVSVTGKEDIPEFGPKLPNPAVFKKGPEFREFLLTKLINAELAAYKSAEISKLVERTRLHLLRDLVEELQLKNDKILDQNPLEGSQGSEKGNILSQIRNVIRSSSQSNNRLSRSLTNNGDVEMNGDVASIKSSNKKEKKRSLGLTKRLSSIGSDKSDTSKEGKSKSKLSIIRKKSSSLPPSPNMTGRKILSEALNTKDVVDQVQSKLNKMVNSSPSSLPSSPTSSRRESEPQKRPTTLSITNGFRRRSEPVSDSKKRPPSPMLDRLGEEGTIMYMYTSSPKPDLQTSSTHSSTPSGSVTFDEEDWRSYSPSISVHGVEDCLIDSGTEQSLRFSRSLSSPTLKEKEMLQKQVELLSVELSRLKAENQEIVKQNKILQRESKRNRERHLHQTANLYEAQCELNKLREHHITCCGPHSVTQKLTEL